MNHMDFELYSAVISGNNEALKKIEGRLSFGDQRTPTHLTVLHLASQYGNLRCVEEILSKHQTLLLRVNSRGETALHLAAREGHCDVANALINAAKCPLLHLNHLGKRSSSAVEFLIRTADLEYETPLHKAVRYNHLKVVELLVTEDPSHLHPQNKNDETPLYLASLRGYKDIIKIILDNCVSPTFGGPNGRTALHGAVLDHGRTVSECVKLLLDKKKDLIKVADDYGWTVFHYVAYQNHYDIVEDLVNVDKSVAYLADKVYKKIPLHIAVYEGSIAVMDELLKYCPDSSDIVDGSGRNILHIAVEQFHKDIIRYVLTNCKEIKTLLTQKDKQGNTPLHLMAKLGCCVPEVIHHKQVDWEVLNDENLTPLDVLFSTQEALADQWEIRRTLVEANNVKRHWNLGRTVREPDIENGKAVALYVNKRRDEKEEDSRKMIKTQMIVVALIATVALTAGFAMPGGFDGNAGPNQGSPSLIKKTAFRVFVVTDTIAVLCSISSLFIYFMTTLYKGRPVQIVARTAAVLNVFSIITLMLAFTSGTYAVLVHSSALAISVCVISSLFFLLLFWFVVIHPLLRFIYKRMFNSLYSLIITDLDLHLLHRLFIFCSCISCSLK